MVVVETVVDCGGCFWVVPSFHDIIVFNVDFGYRYLDLPWWFLHLDYYGKFEHPMVRDSHENKKKFFGLFETMVEVFWICFGWWIVCEATIRMCMMYMVVVIGWNRPFLHPFDVILFGCFVGILCVVHIQAFSVLGFSRERIGKKRREKIKKKNNS